jgi:hypothetical protein
MLCLSYYAYVFSSTKSVTRAERNLPETEEGRVGKCGGGRHGGEMTQTMYAHNKKTLHFSKRLRKTTEGGELSHVHGLVEST